MPKRRVMRKNGNGGNGRIEFSKIILVFILFWGMVHVSASFVLAALDKNVNEAVTISIITTIIGSLISYFIYQAKLKISRDKYRVDKDGVPYDLEEDDENSVGNLD
jgi:hypothetical protein